MRFRRDKLLMSLPVRLLTSAAADSVKRRPIFPTFRFELFTHCLDLRFEQLASFFTAHDQFFFKFRDAMFIGRQPDLQRSLNFLQPFFESGHF